MQCLKSGSRKPPLSQHFSPTPPSPAHLREAAEGSRAFCFSLFFSYLVIYVLLKENSQRKPYFHQQHVMRGGVCQKHQLIRPGEKTQSVCLKAIQFHFIYCLLGHFTNDKAAVHPFPVEIIIHLRDLNPVISVD